MILLKIGGKEKTPNNDIILSKQSAVASLQFSMFYQSTDFTAYCLLPTAYCLL
jgi:hypothetical protein